MLGRNGLPGLLHQQFTGGIAGRLQNEVGSGEAGGTDRTIYQRLIAWCLSTGASRWGAVVVNVMAARVGKGVERMLLTVPPLDEAQALPWPAHWFCG
ncbi:hypothetical protein [Synechococcus sp. BA-132 BA5]|uniref:hypothetical protein n=1 Tax=Synechococcus sp. BA-132 BA5 TaxID=3110252 RepID=UPI002B1F3FA9|nr:hypothetical protein [Synechococcus sp. BA-132 BA5]MEA5416748.1 hypothetical protein [Synechococcus sp. BA-132 BA5]